MLLCVCHFGERKTKGETYFRICAVVSPTTVCVPRHFEQITHGIHLHLHIHKTYVSASIGALFCVNSEAREGHSLVASCHPKYGLNYVQFICAVNPMKMASNIAAHYHYLHSYHASIFSDEESKHARRLHRATMIGRGKRQWQITIEPKRRKRK